jgi:hypothetical protein
MSEPIVTISGQRVYPRGQMPEPGGQSARPDARDAEGRPLTLTEMSPSGWASGSNEETFEAGLPFLGALIGVIAVTLVALLLAKHRRRRGQNSADAT